MSQALFDRIGAAQKMGDNYGSRIKDGRHRLAIMIYKVKATRAHGDSVACDFIVLDSSGPAPHAKGETVSTIWLVNQNGDPGAYARDRAQGFIQAACGLPDVADVPKYGAAFAGPAQYGRGITIFANATSGVSKNGKAFTNVTWEHDPAMTPETIKACRDWLEATYAGQIAASSRVSAPSPEVAAPAPVAAAAPAPAAFPFKLPGM